MNNNFLRFAMGFAIFSERVVHEIGLCLGRLSIYYYCVNVLNTKLGRQY